MDPTAIEGTILGSPIFGNPHNDTIQKALAKFWLMVENSG